MEASRRPTWKGRTMAQHVLGRKGGWLLLQWDIVEKDLPRKKDRDKLSEISNKDNLLVGDKVAVPS